MFWGVPLAVLLVLGLIVSLAVALPLTQTRRTTWYPSVTAVEPSVSVTPWVTHHEAPLVSTYHVVLYDQFEGTAGVPLVSHVANEPAGVGWVASAADSPYELTLNGTGAALNSVVSWYNALLLIEQYWGANQSSGNFSARGYEASTDILESRVTFTLPNIVDLALFEPGTVLTVMGALGRSTPQKDRLVFTLNYILKKDTPGQSYQLTVQTVTDMGGPSEKTLPVFDTHVASATPPLGVPIEVVVAIAPSGECYVNCLALGIDGISGNPQAPVLVPRAGYVLEQQVLMTRGVQVLASNGQPLHVLFSDVQVRAVKPDGTLRQLL